MLARAVAEVKSIRGTVMIFPGFARKLENPNVYASLGLVLLLHIALIWLLASQLILPRNVAGITNEIQATLIPLGTHPKPDSVPESQFQTAIVSEVPAPDIQIQDATPVGGGIGAISTAMILPPRPDPAIRNASPGLPAEFAKVGNAAEVLLTILVNADGSVGEARVAKSCGVALLDQLAQSFAKANWRFRAATANGEAVSAWTTVIMKFAPPS